jgi:hypothetical protein
VTTTTLYLHAEAHPQQQGTGRAGIANMKGLI